MTKFVAVTEALPPDEAWLALGLALKRYGLHMEDLDPEADIIVDTFRNTSGGVLHRYRVRRDRLETG